MVEILWCFYLPSSTTSWVRYSLGLEKAACQLSILSHKPEGQSRPYVQHSALSRVCLNIYLVSILLNLELRWGERVRAPQESCLKSKTSTCMGQEITAPAHIQSTQTRRDCCFPKCPIFNNNNNITGQTKKQENMPILKKKINWHKASPKKHRHHIYQTKNLK